MFRTLKTSAVALLLVAATACNNNSDSDRVYSGPGSQAGTLVANNINGMKSERSSHTATLLQDGRVLVVGGKTSNGVTQSTEIFDPTTGQWTFAGALSVARMNHGAAMLPSGEVLIVGGQSDINGRQSLSSTEIYDPNNDSFRAGPSLSIARSCATVLAYDANGQSRVLIAGGSRFANNQYQSMASTEVFNPGNQSLSAGPSMNQDRYCARAVQLGQQIIFQSGWTGLGVAGGLAPAQPAVLDLGSMQFSIQQSPNPRADGSLTLVGNQIVSVGGRIDASQASSSVEAFINSQWLASPSPLVESRWDHQGVAVGNEMIVIAGRDDMDAKISTEVLANGQRFPGPNLVSARSLHTATTLNNGHILVTGGENGAGIPLSAAEILAPAGAVVPGSTSVVPLPGTGTGTVPGTTTPPTLTAVDPSSGPVGTVMTLTGSGFGSGINNNRVEINGAFATVTAASSNQLTVVVPFGATSGPVTVTVNNQTAIGPSFTVTTGSGGSTGPKPEILFVIPRSAAAFVPVSITGRRFGSNPRAVFNGTPSISVLSFSIKNLPLIGTVGELVTLVPPGATSGDLVVESGGQQSDPVSFTVR